MSINDAHAPSQSRVCGRENLRIGFYFVGLILMACQSTVKTAKIGPLENFTLYGIRVSAVYIGQLSKNGATSYACIK